MKNEEKKFYEQPLIYIGLMALATVIFILGLINFGQLVGLYTLFGFTAALANPDRRKTFVSMLKEFRVYKKGMFGLGLLILIAFMAIVGPFIVHKTTHKPLSAPEWAGELTDANYYDDFYAFKTDLQPGDLGTTVNVEISYNGTNFFGANYTLANEGYDDDSSLQIQFYDDKSVGYTNYYDAITSEIEVKVTWTVKWDKKFFPRIVENGFYVKSDTFGNFTAKDVFDPQGIYVFKDFSVYLKLHNMTGQEFLNYLDERNIAYTYSDPRYGVKLGEKMSPNAPDWTKLTRDIQEGYGYKLVLFEQGAEIDVQLVFRFGFSVLKLAQISDNVTAIEEARKVGGVRILIDKPYMFVWSNYYGLMGTDHRGTDLLYRIIRGAGISLIIGVTVSLVSALLGAMVGIVSGYYGGRVDELIMRVIDFIMSIPHLPLLIVLVIVFDSMGVNRVYSIFVLLTIFGWPGISRVIRSQVLSLKSRPFIDAAKAAGASNRYIMFKHLAPNVIPLIMIYIMTGAPLAILSEASLSFLGLGPAGDWDSWGTILRDASNIVIFQAGTPGQASKIVWWFIFFPGLFLMLIGVAFMFIGYTLEEIYNPKRRGL